MCKVVQMCGNMPVAAEVCQGGVYVDLEFLLMCVLDG